MLTPPVVDGHYVEGESLRVDLFDAPAPTLIFNDTEIVPVIMPMKWAKVWSYGDLFTVALQRLEDRGMLHVRIQSQSFALWFSHRAWLDAADQIAEAFEVPALHTTRLDIAVDVEGLDVVHELCDYCIGHRGGPGGGVKFDGRGGRQIEIGTRAGAKRFLRIYRKDLMDCATYLATWQRQGYTGGRVVRVEVEFKNGGLPSRDPTYYLDGGNLSALYGDAVTRYRIVTTAENSTRADVQRASRRNRAVTHPAWLALCDDANKWMMPPEPKWTRRQRLDAARSRVNRALGGLAARLAHRHAEMDDIDSTLESLRALGTGIIIQPITGWQVVGGPVRAEGLDNEEFLRAREQTLKREALLEGIDARSWEKIFAGPADSTLKFERLTPADPDAPSLGSGKARAKRYAAAVATWPEWPWPASDPT